MRSSGLNSCFGPLGRLKAISNTTGAIVVTTESQALLAHQCDCESDEFTKFTGEQLIKNSTIRGDGLITSVIVQDYLFAQISSELNLNAPYDSSTVKRRILHMQALECVHSIVLMLKAEITAYMANAKMWHGETSIKRMIAFLCHNVLANSNSLRSVTNLVVRNVNTKS